MTSSLDMVRGRSNIVTLTNNSGGALVAGDVCIQDTSADEKITTTTSAASVLKIFIAAEAIGIGAAGRFYSGGYCPLVTPSASVTRGNYLFTHTVAKQAAESATYNAGAFGVILKSGTTPSVWLFGATAQGSGGGVARSGSTTGNNLAVWNGSNADSLKDGGAALADGAWTDYSSTSTVVGWGSTTNKQIYYKLAGKTVFVAYRITGTSNSATTTFTLPATAVAAPGVFVWFASALDNGGTYTTAYCQVAAGGNVATLYKDAAINNWTAGGQKEVYGQFWYIST